VAGTTILSVALVANLVLTRPHERWLTSFVLSLVTFVALFALLYMVVWSIVRVGKHLALATGFVTVALVLDAFIAAELVAVLVMNSTGALPLMFYFFSLLGSVAAAARLWRLYLEPPNPDARGQ